MPLRVCSICGLLSPLAFVIGWAAGGLAQPDAYSLVADSVSDLGALTAHQAWIYNQVGANLTGLLVAALAYGLWEAGIPGLAGRIGVIALAVLGTPTLIAGFATVVVFIGLLFVGGGLAVRLGLGVWFTWVALVSYRLLRIAREQDQLDAAAGPAASPS